MQLFIERICTLARGAIDTAAAIDAAIEVAIVTTAANAPFTTAYATAFTPLEQKASDKPPNADPGDSTEMADAVELHVTSGVHNEDCDAAITITNACVATHLSDDIVSPATMPSPDAHLSASTTAGWTWMWRRHTIPSSRPKPQSVTPPVPPPMPHSGCAVFQLC